MKKIEIVIAMLLASHVAVSGIDSRTLRSLQTDLQSSAKTKAGAHARIQLAVFRINGEVGDETVDAAMAGIMLNDVARVHEVSTRFGALARLNLIAMRLQNLCTDDDIKREDAERGAREIIATHEHSDNSELIAIVKLAREHLLQLAREQEPAQKRNKVDNDNNLETESEPQTQPPAQVQVPGVRDRFTMPYLTDIQVVSFVDRAVRYYYDRSGDDEIGRGLIHRDMDRLGVQTIEAWQESYDGHVNFNILRLLSLMFNIRFVVEGLPTVDHNHRIYLGNFPELIRDLRLSYSDDGRLAPILSAYEAHEKQQRWNMQIVFDMVMP